MNRRHALTTIGLSTIAGSLLGSCDRTDNQGVVDDAVPEPSADDGLVELLFVQLAESVRFEREAMTLVNVEPLTLFFSDRPDDIAGYLNYSEFIAMVGTGPDSFADDPPNATLIIFGEDEVGEVVLELSAKPELAGNDLLFSSVKVIGGELPATGGESALFIDTIGRPLSPGSVAGVHRRHRRRRARRTPGPR
jgi:hypothetical protein